MVVAVLISEILLQLLMILYLAMFLQLEVVLLRL